MDKKNLPIVVHAVLTKDTIREFENMYQFFKNHGFKEYQITFYCVHPMPFKNYEAFLPSEEELKSFYKRHNWPIFPKNPLLFFMRCRKECIKNRCKRKCASLSCFRISNRKFERKKS